MSIVEPIENLLPRNSAIWAMELIRSAVVIVSITLQYNLLRSRKRLESIIASLCRAVGATKAVATKEVSSFAGFIESSFARHSADSVWMLWRLDDQHNDARICLVAIPSYHLCSGCVGR